MTATETGGAEPASPTDVTPLEAYDPAQQGDLGTVGYPEFQEFSGGHHHNPMSVWKRLAALSAYSAGIDVPPSKGPHVGRLTPGPKEGLRPFMFTAEGDTTQPDMKSLAESRVAVSGLYEHMNYPGKIVISGFGPMARNMVHEFLNDRIRAGA